jgi:hypothetical protein
LQNYLQPTPITGLTIQAPNYETVWTREFKLSVSNDGQTWATVQQKGSTLFFPANSAPTVPITVVFDAPLECRYVRVCPTKWNQAIGLRLELHGPHSYYFGGPDLMERLAKLGAIEIPGDTLHYLFRAVTGPAAGEGSSEEAEAKPKRLGLKLVVTAVGLTRKQIAAWLNSNPAAIKAELQAMAGWTAQVR